MDGTQIRAARVLLKRSQSDLAERALINRRTVVNLENDEHAVNPHTLASVRRAFESAGIAFQNGELARIKIA
jgi:DNA-binding XRE family transcriptional regulator